MLTGSINSNESTPLIVQKCRGTEHLKVDPGDKCTLAGLSQNDFHDVFATAKKVTGWIGITGATATVMNFSQMVAGGTVTWQPSRQHPYYLGRRKKDCNGEN